MVWGLRFRVSDLNVLKILAWTYGSFPKLGVPYFGGPYHKAPTLGTLLGSPIFGNSHIGTESSMVSGLEGARGIERLRGHGTWVVI